MKINLSQFKSELKYFLFDHLTLLVVLAALFGTIIGFYTYFCLFMAPDIAVTDLDVRYAQNRDKDTHLKFNFKVENIRYGKSIEGEFYSAFLTLKPKTAISIFSYSFSKLPDLVEEQKITVPGTKSMDKNDFLRHIENYGGLFLAVVVRWKSDNPIFGGRIFENNWLAFLRPKPGQNGFIVEHVEQVYRTYWFKRNLRSPDMNIHIKKLDSIRLYYEDLRAEAIAPKRLKN